MSRPGPGEAAPGASGRPAAPAAAWTRRGFLARIGGASLIYALDLGCSRPGSEDDAGDFDLEPGSRGPFDYDAWLVVGRDGAVTAYTGRTEIGQGLTTVLHDLICQGLEIPRARLTLVMGDTERCPNDGPTTGSNATRLVGWGYWNACERLRHDAIELAAQRLGRPPDTLIYRDARVMDPADASVGLDLGELGDGRPRVARTDATSTTRDPRTYVDRRTLNVRGEAIVTGTQIYAGDLRPEGCLHGAYALPPYHSHLTRVDSVDLAEAQTTPGLRSMHHGRTWVAAVGDSYTSVRRALERARVEWREPRGPQQIDPEHEIRAGAKRVRVVEERGDPAGELQKCDHVFRETYVTQPASQAPLETDTAVAEVRRDGATVWIGTQNPFLVRRLVARELGLPESKVRVVGMPTGGAFGSKAGHVVGPEAARLSRLAGGAPVKYVYSREDEFQLRARYKEVVVVDLVSGVSADGKLVAREIDIFQDRGKGTEKVYDVPHVRTHLWSAPMPTRHATMRGTSFTQTCFALESHVDSIARGIGLDPLELRRRNVGEPVFVRLLDACADRIGHGRGPRGDGRGIGFAICWHGGAQLGAVAAEVMVDRATGEVEVRRLCGAFDIGIVINRNTLEIGVRGAMLWGLGYALFEEAHIDRHSSYAARLSEYRLPRFADVPPIDLDFFDETDKSKPRGCGEMPLVPTIGAIANAVCDATGVRFHTLPLTPERVLAGLRAA